MYVCPCMYVRMSMHVCMSVYVCTYVCMYLFTYVTADDVLLDTGDAGLSGHTFVPQGTDGAGLDQTNDEEEGGPVGR